MLRETLMDYDHLFIMIFTTLLTIFQGHIGKKWKFSFIYIVICLVETASHAWSQVSSHNAVVLPHQSALLHELVTSYYLSWPS